MSVFSNMQPDEAKQWFAERSRGAQSALLAGAFSLALAVVGGSIAANGAVVSGAAAVFRAAADWIMRFLAQNYNNPS
jgi:hypothetical protein